MFFCWNLFPERYTPKNSSCPGPYGLGMTWQPASAKETLCQGEKHTGTIPWPCGMSWSLRERLQYEQTHTHRYMTLGCPPCDHSMESTAEHTHVLVVVTQICVSPALTPPSHPQNGRVGQFKEAGLRTVPWILSGRYRSAHGVLRPGAAGKCLQRQWGPMARCVRLGHCPLHFLLARVHEHWAASSWASGHFAFP